VAAAAAAGRRTGAHDKVVRRCICVAALAFVASAAIGACGSVQTDPATTTPVTFGYTVTAAVTTTVPEPTATTYIGPQAVDIETGPFLAPAVTTPLGKIIDGIQCNPLRQLAYRAYVHLQIYVRGSSRALPGGIGMVDPNARVTDNGLVFNAQTCYYWLHTSAADGVIAVESPRSRRFTLGDFFAVWNQRLSPNAVAGETGRVTALVNGKPWHRSPRLIPLTEHAQIELAVGKPVPAYRPIDWSVTTL